MDPSDKESEISEQAVIFGGATGEKEDPRKYYDATQSLSSGSIQMN